MFTSSPALTVFLCFFCFLLLLLCVCCFFSLVSSAFWRIKMYIKANVCRQHVKAAKTSRDGVVRDRGYIPAKYWSSFRHSPSCQPDGAMDNLAVPCCGSVQMENGNHLLIDVLNLPAGRSRVDVLRLASRKLSRSPGEISGTGNENIDSGKTDGLWRFAACARIIGQN